MSRGAIWTADLEPAQGREANKVRPVVLVGRDALIRRALADGGTVTVAPLTTNVAKVFGFQVLLPAERSGLPRDSKVQAEQIRTVSTARLLAHVGQIDEELNMQVDQAIRVYLGL
ncbi:type II toxin-antitoxin system PemK/MazF family toxin [Demequina salsinemoris]|uniref:type II toxin-antitoxin system PemK/MazF family toxin n=1 Tax=Demequina salsinemoris TaxID=577470 RepID=UPI000784A220|nr:type II toxin-antitoxin system PemK/MazF family toxin [Demequina salsinemoris]